MFSSDPFRDRDTPADASRHARDLERFERLRTGDEQAFEALFRAYAAALCDFAHSYVDSEPAAQEIVQDLFARLWERRDTLDRPRSVQAYLYGATRNGALNYLRGTRVETAFLRRVLHAGQVRSNGPRPIPPEDELHAQALADAVAGAVATLPPRCRDVFILTRDQHLSYAEAAAVLGIAPKTVEIHVGRALALLRRQLADWLP